MTARPDTADFLLVGAGIAGASLAWRLADDYAVTLLEAESQPGLHATGRSAAFFSEVYGNECVRAITAASRAFFEAPPPGFAGYPLLEERGALTFATPAQEAALRAHFDELRQRTDEVSLESADFALRRVPVLKPDQVAACIWEPGARRIDVHGLLQGFMRGARQRGAQLVTDARVEAIERVNDEWQVQTSAGVWRGRVLVNAAGAWADEVAALAGATPAKLSPLRRTACVIDTQGELDSDAWPAVTDAEENFYFIPDAGRFLLSPADETPMPAGDVYADDLDVALAVDRLERATTLSVTRVVQQWAGLRTFAPDRKPVVGFDPAVENFFWLAGQGGFGIQTAPALSRLAAELLRGKSLDRGLSERGVTPEMLAPGRPRA